MKTTYEDNSLITEEAYYNLMGIIMQQKYDTEKELLKAVRSDIAEDKKNAKLDPLAKPTSSTKALDQYIDKNFADTPIEEKTIIKEEMLGSYNKLKAGINQTRIAGIDNTPKEMIINAAGMLANIAMISLGTMPVMHYIAAHITGEHEHAHAHKSSNSEIMMDVAVNSGIHILGEQLAEQGFKRTEDLNHNIEKLADIVHHKRQTSKNGHQK